MPSRRHAVGPRPQRLRPVVRRPLPASRPHRGGDAETAADAVQEAFVKAASVAADQPLRRPGRLGPAGRDQPAADDHRRSGRAAGAVATLGPSGAGRTRTRSTSSTGCWRRSPSSNACDGAVLRRRTVDRRDRGRPRHRRGRQVAPARRPAAPPARARARRPPTDGNLKDRIMNEHHDDRLAAELRAGRRRRRLAAAARAVLARAGTIRRRRGDRGGGALAALLVGGWCPAGWQRLTRPAGGVVPSSTRPARPRASR